MTTALYEMVYGLCALCGFHLMYGGGGEEVRMIGHNPSSDTTAPEIVIRYRCRDYIGCERRQRDYHQRPWSIG